VLGGRVELQPSLATVKAHKLAGYLEGSGKRRRKGTTTSSTHPKEWQLASVALQLSIRRIIAML
jgi:hypothetical protein